MPNKSIYVTKYNKKICKHFDVIYKNLGISMMIKTKLSVTYRHSLHILYYQLKLKITDCSYCVLQSMKYFNSVLS